MTMRGWPGESGYAFMTAVEAWRRERDEARHDDAPTLDAGYDYWEDSDEPDERGRIDDDDDDDG